MLMLIATMVTYAQDSTVVKRPLNPKAVHGVVVDEYSQPIKGVTITVKGRANLFNTDSHGQFEIPSADGATLIFSYPEHLVKQLVVKNNTDITVKLDDSFLKNPAQVNVLYGVADKSSVLGSISTIYTNQLTTTPASLYTYALPGQLAGLYTQQTSGFTSFNLGALSSASIIGQNLVNTSSANNGSSDNSEINVTVRGQNPITVIDGVQREISSIDPEAIASISILKDGLSTILLGINSSRPVILITTKQGQAGKPRITFTAQTGLQQSLGLPTPLPAYQYAYLLNETLTSDGKPALYSAADFAAYRDHSDPYGHPDVNWFKTILKDYSPIQSYKLNVNGGSEVAKYSISLGYFDQGGIFKTADAVPYSTNTDLSRYMINSDVSVQVNKNLNVDLQLFGRIQTTTQPGTSYNSILNAIYSTPNNAYPIYNRNGSFGGSNIAGINGSYANNLLSQSQFSGYSQNNTNDILANLDLNYNLNSVLKGLTAKLKGNVSYQSITNLTRALQNPSYLYRDSAYTLLGTTSSQSNIFNTAYTARQSFSQFSLNYNRQFGKNNLTATALYDSKSLASNYDLAAITTDMAGKVNYNYDNKYFAEGAVNRSGNNRYPPGHQNGTFYAGGLGWMMSNESFIKDKLSWINSWKWRGTYARTGQDVENTPSLYYAYSQTFSSSNSGYYYAYGTGYNSSYYQFESTLANPFITWQGADKIDFGTDISILNDRFSITADYYHDRYFNVLGYRGNTIALLGTAYPLENIGINLYTGEELTLTYKNHAGNLNYFATGNINIQQSKIIYSDELKTPYSWNARTGLPLGTFYGYTALGFYQTAQDATTSAHIAGYTPQPGDIKYKDLNGDNKIDQYDQSTIGGTKPLIFYGLTLGANYKGFSFSAILQGVANRQINVQNNVIDNFGLDNSNVPQQTYLAATGRWTPETANTATLPRLALSGYNNNNMFSTFYLKSGNYMRLKNAELGYTLPYTFTKKLRISGLKVFVNGENLLTASAFKGEDPEVGPYNYPVQRVFNAGFSIKL